VRPITSRHHSSSSLKSLRNPLLIAIPDLHVLLHRLKFQISDLCILAIKDLGEFFNCWTSSFAVEELDEDKFDEDPNLRACVIK